MHFFDPGSINGCNSLTFLSVATDNSMLSSLGGLVYNKLRTKLVRYPPGKTGVFTLPSTVQEIDDQAFIGSASLTEVTIPTSVTTIGFLPFQECTNLLNINVLPGNANFTSINGVLFTVDQRELLRYPPAKTGAYAIPHGTEECVGVVFLDNPHLQVVEFPASFQTGTGKPMFQGSLDVRQAIFLGDAPNLQTGISPDVHPNFISYYSNTNSGYATPLWEDYPAIPFAATNYPASAWLSNHGFAPNTDLSLDLNGDGVPLIAALAFGLDPFQNLAGQLPQAQRIGNQLQWPFPATTPGVLYLLSHSSDLLTWSEDQLTFSPPDGQHEVTARYPLNGAEGYLRFDLNMP